MTTHQSNRATAPQAPSTAPVQPVALTPTPTPGASELCRLAATAPHEARDEVIVALRRDGLTLTAIAAVFGLTRERVRQIVDERHGPSNASVRRRRVERRVAAEGRRRDVVERFLAANPGAGACHVAAAVGLPAAEVRRLLGADARRRLVATAHGAAPATDDDLLAGLRAAAATVDGALTGTAYQSYAQVHGLHSTMRIIQRFGSWSAGCRRAGVTPGQPRRAAYTRRWTREDLIDWAALYVVEPDCPGSYSGYAAFAQRTPGAPSAQTLRNQLGTWSTIKTLALRRAAGHEAARLERDSDELLTP